ncbi:MAG: hypothetical protein K6D59_05895 [Bacteroidales bacterium]|nr:hypothetical protein [Bacteroidales bacterium]
MERLRSFYEKLYKFRFLFPLLFIVGYLAVLFSVSQTSRLLWEIGSSIVVISLILIGILLVLSLIFRRFRVLISSALALILGGCVSIWAWVSLEYRNGNNVIEMLDTMDADPYDIEVGDNNIMYMGGDDEYATDSTPMDVEEDVCCEAATAAE